jgi:hypothetical protein
MPKIKDDCIMEMETAPGCVLECYICGCPIFDDDDISTVVECGTESCVHLSCKRTNEEMDICDMYDNDVYYDMDNKE